MLFLQKRCFRYAELKKTHSAKPTFNFVKQERLLQLKQINVFSNEKLILKKKTRIQQAEFMFV